MHWRTAKPVITAKNLNIGVADARKSNADERPALSQFWLRLFLAYKSAAVNNEREHSTLFNHQRSTAASVLINSGSCSGKTVRRSRMRRSSSTRAMTETPGGARRRGWSRFVAEDGALAHRMIFLGRECEGLDPPPAPGPSDAA